MRLMAESERGRFDELSATKHYLKNPTVVKTSVFVFVLMILSLTAIRCPAQSTVIPYSWSTIGGTYLLDLVSGLVLADGGYGDGNGTNALFDGPYGVAVDSKGNLYVADTGNQVIRKMAPPPAGSTVWQVSLLAGQPTTSGYQDSDMFGDVPLFNNPSGVAVDANFNVYVADSGNNAIREITPDGTVSTLAGNPNTPCDPTITSAGGCYVNGPGYDALFNLPVSVAVDSKGNLYVSDQGNQVIRKMTPPPAGSSAWEVSTLAGSPGAFGSANGPGTSAQFDYPEGVAVDGAGNVYVADSENNMIRKITPDGTVSTLAGAYQELNFFQSYGALYGDMDGPGSTAQFYNPGGVAVDGAGNVYVADTDNCEIRKVTPDGMVTTLGGKPVAQGDYIPDPPEYPFYIPIGEGYRDGTGDEARFYFPYALAVDLNGNLYVADTDNSLIRKGAPPVVQVVALEVTQVIQDWNNSVPLVQGKETYVRAHLQLPPGVSQGVMVSGAVLYGTGPDGSPLPGSFTTPINLDATLFVETTNAADPSIRGTFVNSLNFRLPSEWLTGSIALRLAWPGTLAPINGLPANCAVAVTFVPVPVLKVKFFDVQWTDLSGTTHQLGEALADLRNRVLSCYPVPDVDATYGTLNIPGLQLPDFGSGKHVFTSMVTELLNTQHANDVAYLDGLNSKGVVGIQIYHGGIQVADYTPPPPPPGSKVPSLIDGLAEYPFPSFASSGTVLGMWGEGRQTASHELGHNLGLYHDIDANSGLPLDVPLSLGQTTLAYWKGPCGELAPISSVYPLYQPFHGYAYPPGAPALGPLTSGDNSLIYGWDPFALRYTLEAVVPPTNSTATDRNYYFDLMSYCRPPGFDTEDLWPSSFTYKTLLQNIINIFGPATPMLRVGGAPLAKDVKTPIWSRPQTPRPSGGGEGYLIVRGNVDFIAGTAQFLPCLALTTTNSPPSESPGTNFVLEALDDMGAVLQTIQFALQPSIFEGTDDTNTSLTADFVVSLNANPSIHTLLLSYNGGMLATLTASPTAPTLTLTAPNGGQNFASGAISVAWSGSDSDGDTLAYTVQYSADDGASWETLAVDWPDQSMPIDSSILAATTQGLMRVIASDGFNTTIAQSASTFIVQPHAPSVTINAPMNGSIFIGDQQVFLDAYANDMQDGVLSGTNVQWYSDRDGTLGAGAIVNFDAKILSEGNHTITVTAIDSAGLTNSAVTHVLVSHYPTPQLGIQVASPLVVLSWPSYYTNYVLQGSSNLASDWAAITSPSPVALGSQNIATLRVSKGGSFFRLMFQP
jgi:sugar lactone lactonase YvrE